MKTFLVLSLVLLVAFLEQSNAGIGNIISSALDSSSSQSLDQLLEQAEKNRKFETADELLDGITAKDDDAYKIADKGITESLDLFQKSVNVTYEGLKDITDSLGNTSSENLIQSLKLTFNKTYGYMIGSGVKAYTTFGQLAQIVGPKKGFYEATYMLTASEQEIFNALFAARDIGIQGINDGTDAAKQAIKVIIKTLESSEEGINKMVRKIAKNVKDAISSGPTQYSVDLQDTSNKDMAAEKSKLSQNAIKSVQDKANNALSQVSSASKQEAIKILSSKIIDSLKSIALAGQICFQGIDKTSSIADSNTAISTLEKSIKSAEKECLKGIAGAQETYGRIFEIMGTQFEAPTFQAMVTVESGRENCIKALENIIKIATDGINYDAAKTVLAAAREGVESAGIATYSQLVKSAISAIDAIVSA